MRNNKLALGVIIVLAVLATILGAVPSVSTYDHDQTCNANATYFVEENISLQYCNNTNVSIWANTSVPLTTGRVTFDYTFCCANATAFYPNSTNWENYCNGNLNTPGKVLITFATLTAGHSGDGTPVHIGDIEIHCCNESSDCITGLIWNTDDSYLESDMEPVEPVNWANGLFRCEPPSVATTGDIIINEMMYAPTSAWGGSTNEWVELYNNDTKSINISDWAIDDKSIPEAIMQPGDYLIIAKNDTKFKEFYSEVICPVIKVAIVLSNTGETIFLNDSQGDVANSVDYTPYASQDLAKNNNKTLELNATGGWEESRVEGGTPCQLNSVLVRPPNITSYAPETPVYDAEGATRTFTITIDQPMNVSWLINGTVVKDTEEGVTEASYTNVSAKVGIWNVSAIVENANGSGMQTWIWKVTEAGAAPTADSLGVEDASGRSGTYVEVPVNITNVMNGPVLGIGFDIAYDKNVINVTDVSKGNLVPSNWADPNVNNNFTWGTKITIAGFYAADAIPNGTSGTVVLLNFSVIGSPGDTSPLNMSFIELANPDGITGTAPARNGTFVVAEFGAIVGRITYTCNETGIADAIVNLTKEGAVVNTTMTNETGYYNFTDVTPDGYFVNASKLRFLDNSTEVTVIAGETITADMMLWLKGDLNGDGKSADTGDLVLMNRASVGEITGDRRYDLNKNGIIADVGDLVLMNRASVKDIELL